MKNSKKSFQQQSEHKVRLILKVYMKIILKIQRKAYKFMVPNDRYDVL